MTEETSLEQPEMIDQDEDETVTFTFKRSHFWMVLVPVAFILGLTVGYFQWGRGTAAGAATTNSAIGAQIDVPEDVPRYDIPIDESDPSQGPVDAPIVIVEYSDFECPYCRRHNLEVKGQLMAAYPDLIRYIHKDFPISSIHPNATSASEAALCAYEQGAFWEFHDSLFSMQLGLSTEAYLGYAESLGLNANTFRDCFAERRYADQVQSDYEFAASLGVRSTPTFFVNGIAVVGAQPYDVFASVIDSELGN